MSSAKQKSAWPFLKDFSQETEATFDNRNLTVISKDGDEFDGGDFEFYLQTISCICHFLLLICTILLSIRYCCYTKKCDKSRKFVENGFHQAFRTILFLILIVILILLQCEAVLRWFFSKILISALSLITPLLPLCFTVIILFLSQTPTVSSNPEVYLLSSFCWILQVCFVIANFYSFTYFSGVNIISVISSLSLAVATIISILLLMDLFILFNLVSIEQFNFLVFLNKSHPGL